MLLPLFLFVIVECVYAVDLSNVPHRDAAELDHRTDHLRRARTELQNYFNEWVRLKHRERLEALRSVTPHPPIPVPYPDLLNNQKASTAEPSSTGLSGSRGVYASQPQNRDVYASEPQSSGGIYASQPQSSGIYPSQPHGTDVYRSQSLQDRPIPKPYGHGLFHLIHLHKPNGDQDSYSWTQNNNQRPEYSYSYIYDKSGSAPCANPPCTSAEKPLHVPPPSVNVATPTKPAYNYQSQYQQTHEYQQEHPTYSIHNQHQQPQPSYPHQQSQPAYPFQQVYNQYEQIQPSHEYPHIQPVYNPYYHIQPGLNSYQQNHPVYQNQETQPANNVPTYPWAPYQKPTVTRVPTKETVLPVYNKFTNDRPYQYDQHNHNYPPPGPLIDLKPIQKVPPIVNKLTPYTGIEQLPSLIPSSASSLSPTGTNATTQVPEITTTESTTSDVVTSDLVEEFIVTTANYWDGVTEETEEDLITSTAQPSEGEDLLALINEAVHEIEAEDATKPNEVTESTPPVSNSFTSPPVNEIEWVQSSTTVIPTLLGVNSEYEVLPTVSPTTEEPDDGLYFKTTQNYYVEENTPTIYIKDYLHSSDKFTTANSGTADEYIPTTTDTYSIIDPEGTEETSPASDVQTSYGVSTELPLLPETSLPSVLYETQPTILEGESTPKETLLTNTEYTEKEKTTIGYKNPDFTVADSYSTTEVPVYTTTVGMGSTMEGTVSPYAETTDEDRTTVSYGHTASTMQEAAESSVYTTTVKMGMTEKTVYPYEGSTAKERERTTVDGENTASTVEETFSTTEVTVYTTTGQRQSTSRKTIAPYLETTETPEKETTVYETTTVPTTETQVFTTFVTTPFKTASPYVETTQLLPEKETYGSPEDHNAAYTTEETVSTAGVPISITTVEKYTLVENAPAYAVTTPRSVQESTIQYTVASAETSTVTDETEQDTEAAFRKLSENSLDNPVSSTSAKKSSSKGIVRREDASAKRQEELMFNDKDLSDGNDLNMVSSDFKDTPRGHVSSKPHLNGFEKRFLKRLIAVVVKELRRGTVSQRDKAGLKEVFGDMWYRIINEAFNGVPVKLAEDDDETIASRLLEYLLKGTPLARRLGMQSVKGRSFRKKRDAKQSGLEPWQEEMLRAIAVGDSWITGGGSDRNHAILQAIKEQFEAPDEEYDYSYEEMDDTTEINVRGANILAYSEYYAEEAEDAGDDGGV